MPVRSKHEMRMGKILVIGQQWALIGDLRLWTVRNVHRVDCQVELVSGTEHKRVGFDDLRRYWEPADHTLLGEAA